jgi:hypothetical protein
LISSDASGCPSSIRENALKLAVQEIKDACLCRQGILYSHDELNVRAIID